MHFGYQVLEASSFVAHFVCHACSYIHAGIQTLDAIDSTSLRPCHPSDHMQCACALFSSTPVGVCSCGCVSLSLCTYRYMFRFALSFPALDASSYRCSHIRVLSALHYADLHDPTRLSIYLCGRVFVILLCDCMFAGLRRDLAAQTPCHTCCLRKQ